MLYTPVFFEMCVIEVSKFGKKCWKICKNLEYKIACKFLIDKKANNRILNANIFINSNYNKTVQTMINTMIGRSIVIVTNKLNIRNIKELEKLNIKPYKISTTIFITF